MDERTALDVIAVRALETDAQARHAWTDADRAWASRAAAEVVGEHASPAQFLGRRAALALERIGEHDPRFVRAVRSLLWRPWVGNVVVGAAFAIGVLVDRIGGTHTINLLAPPVFALLVWNLAVYGVLAMAMVRRRESGAHGIVRGAVARIAAGRRPASRSARYAAAADAWTRMVAPLYGARAARILHFAGAALALGVIAGLYVRGVALEYRATWESTFLDPTQVRALLAVTLSPGAAITGIGVPDTAHVASIRAPASENAALWLHLIAATVVAVVVVPRLALGTLAAYLERRRATRIAVPFAEPYFQRLLRGFRGGAARVRIAPYSYTPTAAAMTGLEAVVGRSFGGSAALIVEAPVPYGGDPTAARGAEAHTIALFNATATPERDVHGAFVARLAADDRTITPLIALVDESAFRARAGADPGRLEQRRATWRDAIGTSGAAVVFADLDAPDLTALEVAFDDALGARAGAAR